MSHYGITGVYSLKPVSGYLENAARGLFLEIDLRILGKCSPRIIRKGVKKDDFIGLWYEKH